MVQEVGEKFKEEFNKSTSHPIQSWEWGEFRKKTGNEIVRLATFKGKKLDEGYLLTIHKIPKTPYKLASFLKGPKPNREMLDALTSFAKKNNLLFIRMEPNVVGEKEIVEAEGVLEKYGARPGKPFFTKTTFIIDLEKSEEELLSSFHPKTRYNIKVAQKKGVEVKEDNSTTAFEKYLDLTGETVKRQGFYAHTRKYHKLMWETLREAGISHLITARFNDEVISTWILFTWHDTLYYPYGASTDKYKEVMANNLLMWEAIRLGKSWGLKKFDLWGREPGKGFTKFKEGYNPKVVEFLGTWDLVTNPIYGLYRIFEQIRWKALKIKARLPFFPPNF